MPAKKRPAPTPRPEGVEIVRRETVDPTRHRKLVTLLADLVEEHRKGHC